MAPLLCAIGLLGDSRRTQTMSAECVTMHIWRCLILHRIKASAALEPRWEAGVSRLIDRIHVAGLFMTADVGHWTSTENVL